MKHRYHSVAKRNSPRPPCEKSSVSESPSVRFVRHFCTTYRNGEERAPIAERNKSGRRDTCSRESNTGKTRGAREMRRTIRVCRPCLIYNNRSILITEIFYCAGALSGLRVLDDERRTEFPIILSNRIYRRLRKKITGNFSFYRETGNLFCFVTYC